MRREVPGDVAPLLRRATDRVGTQAGPIHPLYKRDDDNLFWYRGVGRPRMSVLATYNSEVSRGIIHTPEWDALMGELQAAFNDELRNQPGVIWNDREGPS
jgi:hypothetical protein